jgi:hypothetical protein
MITWELTIKLNWMWTYKLSCLPSVIWARLHSRTALYQLSRHTRYIDSPSINTQVLWGLSFPISFVHNYFEFEASMQSLHSAPRTSSWFRDHDQGLRTGVLLPQGPSCTNRSSLEHCPTQEPAKATSSSSTTENIDVICRSGWTVHLRNRYYGVLRTYYMDRATTTPFTPKLYSDQPSTSVYQTMNPDTIWNKNHHQWSKKTRKNK